ncbi:MAG TPA: hypothetical protein VHR66_25190 [Gemmataceae bacterium]|nr:hypothetical protein [Gemmataceae bacterium]
MATPFLIVVGWVSGWRAESGCVDDNDIAEPEAPHDLVFEIGEKR